MLPSETMIWQPEFTDKTLSRKPGAVQSAIFAVSDFLYYLNSIASDFSQSP
ncbi:PapI protein [Escherichia coli]|nr:PapI protein [Escherichia coli]